MHALLPMLLGCGGFGFFSILPLLLAGIAIVDVVRNGADWYWLVIILMFPVVGPLAYFALVRSPWGGGRFATLSPTAARRIQAQRRLRELAVQLANWRGPALLVEAGEELLVLGKHAEAERDLLEAQRVGADAEEVNFPLAQAFEMAGRFADAVPLLAGVCAKDEDSRFGLAQLHLARCLDESDQSAEAEKVLRQLLERRNFFEAQVRLARLLLRRGERREAEGLLAEVRTHAASLPRYLKREHREWIRAGKKLHDGGTALPKPRIEGGVPPGRRLRLALIAAAVLVVIGFAGYLMLRATGLFATGEWTELIRQEQTQRNAISALDTRFPWPHDADLTLAEIGLAEVERYVALRRSLAPHLAALAAADRFEESAEHDAGIAEALGANRQWMERQRRKNAALGAARGLLETQQTGPASLGHLANLIEWRFLHRPQAIVLGVPAHFRADWRAAAMQEAWATRAQARPEGETAKQMRRLHAEQQAKLADLERLAEGARQLASGTRAILEQHRGELESLPAADLDALAALVAGVPAWDDD